MDQFWPLNYERRLAVVISGKAFLALLLFQSLVFFLIKKKFFLLW